MVFLNLLSLGVHLPRGDFLTLFILRKTTPFRQANGKQMEGNLLVIVFQKR